MKIISILFLLFTPLLLQAQIESGKSKMKRPKKTTLDKKAEKPDTSGADPFYLYMSYGYGSSFRSLKPNGSFYGEELGERANETPLPGSVFSLGVRTELRKHFFLDFGFGTIGYGEQYSGTSGDTVTTWKNTYRNLRVPIKARFMAGKKISVFAATGLQAQLLYKYRGETTVQIGDNSSTSTDKMTGNMNVFTLVSCSDAGLQYNFSDSFGIYLAGEFYYQLTSTFLKQEPYIHKPYLYTGTIGVVMAF